MSSVSTISREVRLPAQCFSASYCTTKPTNLMWTDGLSNVEGFLHIWAPNINIQIPT